MKGRERSAENGEFAIIPRVSLLVSAPGVPPLPSPYGQRTGNAMQGPFGDAARLDLSPVLQHAPLYNLLHRNPELEFPPTVSLTLDSPFKLKAASLQAQPS